ncbi:Predicted oxidoreductase [Tranquillimonas rosea]|uniref:Predicted oxidoreductase n=1 Tax=Tranquillimonas rosea TaxID=641238 RepID=A0A1H9S7X1_9RHOB|nr:aldo/keto reductase [Tranquillimonas rosea]SER81051.1 Predicted oxidoreductase [Tranquillimonas rosea]
MTKITAPDGTPVSPFCFGAMQFGGGADEGTSRALYDACRNRGVNAFDTAHSYTDGTSETYLGRFAARERDRLVIATKAPFSRPQTRSEILAGFDESRRRLGLDSVDILYLHRFDPDTPPQETFETLARLQSDGLIRHVGVSNYAAWQVMRAQAVAAACGTRIDIVQPMYNLVKRQAETEILPMALDEDIAVATYSPLGGGLLSGKYAAGGTGRLTEDERYSARYAPDWMHAAASDLVTLATEVGTDPATLAVAWVARHPAVTMPIVSARTVAQLLPSLAALDFELDDALMARLSALSPAPAPATDRLEEA